MSRRSSRGFTVVELVVVIVIIIVALALLLCCLPHSRDSERRSACAIRQKQLALAMLIYESGHKQFPGYNDVIAGIKCSWIVPILPNLEEDILWQEWERGRPRSACLPVLVCPSDPSARSNQDDAPLSYVVNCGLAEEMPGFADGVCKAEGKGASIDYIAAHDGTMYTLLLGENIQAGWWTDTDKADVGMVWVRTPSDCNRINRCGEAGDRPHDIQYARPSSNHGGMVIVGFCDGHVAPLSEDIDYRVYQHLMTPDGKAVGLTGELNENDF